MLIKKYFVLLRNIWLPLFMILFNLSSEVLAQKDTVSIFELSIEEIMNLNAEITTGSKSIISAQDAPGTVYLITRYDIENMGLRTLSDALNFVPGFTVGKGIQAGQQKNIYVRGEFSLLSEGILILYNGQRINDGITGGGVAFNPDYTLDNIKQIEIIRGPGSALYGANAFVGVVNLITFDPEDVNGIKTSYRAGSSGSHYANIEYGNKINDNLNITGYGSFTRFDDDLKQRDIHQSVFDSSANDFVPVELKNRVNSEKVRLVNFGGALKFKRLLVDGYFNFSTNRNNWGSGAESSDKKFQNETKSNNLRIGIKYSLPMLKSSKLNFLASYLHHNSDTDFIVENFQSILAPAIGRAKDASILESEWQTSTLNFESFIELNLSNDHQTIAGVNFQSDFIINIDNFTGVEDRDGDGIFDTQIEEDTLGIKNNFDTESRQVYAGFVQHIWNPFESFTLTGGARFDRYSDFGSTLNPRLAAVYSPMDKLTLKTLYGQAIRAPAFFELNKIELNEIGVDQLIENPNLDPETVRTFEYQVNFHPVPYFSLSVMRFSNLIKNAIRQVPTDNPEFPTQLEWRNAGIREWNGVEIEGRYVPSTNFSVFSNYSYTNTEDELVVDVDIPVVGVPRHSINFGINFYVFDKVNINVNGNSRFGWNDVPELATSSFVLEPITLPAYTIWNTHLSLKHVLPRLNFTLSIFNISDAEQYFISDRIFVPQGIAGNSRKFLFGAKYGF